MSEKPPLKRRRTVDAQKGAETQPVQSSRFWFDDGIVILQAENTQFRVHRALLSLHSKVFKDMFSMPQPTDSTTGPNVDGCPIIALSDKASDLEHVLSIFYQNIQSHVMRKLMPFDFLAAILRLGKKYEIDYLCDEGLKRLRTEWPNTLEEWNKSSNHCLCVDSSELEDILQLCCELSISSCLPTVYLQFVATLPLDTIMNMSVDNGGAVDRQIINCSVQGRDKFIRACHGILEKWTKKKLFSRSQRCSSTNSNCAHNKLMASQLIFGSTENGFGVPQLESWYNFNFPDDFSLCYTCLNSLEAAYEEAREELWDRLPSFFGLPPWEELEDFDAAYNSDI